MKTCIPCGTAAKGDERTCPVCGEASWADEAALADSPSSESKPKRDRK